MSPHAARARAAGGIVLLLALFALLAWGAARTKCPTFDEPQNTVGAWLIAHEADWRAHPDHPALWQYWMSLPNGPEALRPDRSAPRWDEMLYFPWGRVLWTTDMLFATEGVDADRVVGRSRGMMLGVAVLLGALVAFWAWRLAGPIAALTATAFFALDPNVLAHAALVKNDIALGCSAVLLAIALWRLGQKATPARIVFAALAFAIGPGVKFSALVFLPLAAALLLIRAVLPEPWSVAGRTLARRGAKALAAAGLLLVFIVTAWGVIWGAYRFRFAPTPDPAIRLDTSWLLDRMRRDQEEIARFDRNRGVAEVQPDPAASGAQAGPGAWRPGLLLRSVLWAEQHRLLPQAWLYGLVYSESGLVRREGFLMGEHRLTGWWYYMPVAALFKGPLATLAAATAAVVATAFATWRALKRDRRAAAAPSRVGGPPLRTGEECCLGAWSAACVLVPLVVFGTALMASRASVGLRHALPLFPFVFVGIGVAAATLVRTRGRLAAAVVMLLVAGTAAETLPAYPDFIPFFNLASRARRLELLGDSNLDWGQDLPLLAAWRRRHPDLPLYLAYFGQADPATYGIDARRFPSVAIGEAGTEAPPPGQRIYLAVSATHLQGIYARNPQLAQFYEDLSRKPTLAILGGSIYVFDWTRPSP